MVQFGLLSAYDLLDLYMYFKKLMQTDTIKYKAWQKWLSLNKQLGGSWCFGFVFKVPVIWFVRHLIDVEKLQKLWQLQNLDTEAAEIMKSFWFGTNLVELT